MPNPRDSHKSNFQISVSNGGDIGDILAFREEVNNIGIDNLSKSVTIQLKGFESVLDGRAYHFRALRNGELIGVARLNLARDGYLGDYEDLYKMKASPLHPKGTAIATKLIVRNEFRGSKTSYKICLEIYNYCVSKLCVGHLYLGHGPQLATFYRKLGAIPCGENFTRDEGEIVTPAKVDFTNRLDMDRITFRYLSQMERRKIDKGEKQVTRH
jgi:predicted GNAT family N-acyltransferase